MSKVNPQRENGHRQISSEILRELMKAKLSGSEFRIIMAVIHKTWGYGKKYDAISVSQIMDMTGLKERTVKLCKKQLKDKRILCIEESPIRVQNGSPLSYFLLNKHYDTWIIEGCKKLHPSTKGAKKCQKGVQKITPTIDKNKRKKYICAFCKNALFEKFWKSYPRKINRKKSHQKWMKLKLTETLFGQIMSGLQKAKNSKQWQKDNGEFIPHPTTWLNGERWNDEYEPSQGGPRFR